MSFMGVGFWNWWPWHKSNEKAGPKRDPEAVKAAQEQAAAEQAADLANLASTYETLSKLGTSSVERARSGAESVQKAAASIVTIYTGVLAFTFAAGDNPMPARGLLAPLFLGLSVVLSTAYLSYMVKPSGSTNFPRYSKGLEEAVLARLNVTIDYAVAIASRRFYALRASVIALGVGLAYIALPFVALGEITDDGSAQVPAWPAVAPSGMSDALAAVVLKAQVDEIAAQRKAATESLSTVVVNDGKVILWLTVAGLIVTFVGAAFRLDRSPRARAPRKQDR